MATAAPRSRSGLVRKLIHEIRPSSQNDKLYRPVDPNDPDFKSLVKSIRENGLIEPITITLDHKIVSGHRRHAACTVAGVKTMRCRVLLIDSEEDSDGFIKLLREFNRQRVKSADEILREEIVSADPKEAYRRLVDYRGENSKVDVEEVRIVGRIDRSEISPIKHAMLGKALAILKSWREGGHLPGSVRRLHYAMLNDPPMRNKRQLYENDLKSYKDLSDLMTRARAAGIVAEGYLVDETRGCETWNVFRSTAPYVRKQVDQFLKGYYRDLIQSQPHHLEIVCEKLTAKGLVNTVAADFTIPVTVSRGYPSWPPRQEIANRFEHSGKEKLVLICVTDFDPDGEEIVQSLGRSMRDDFGIYGTSVVKACLTAGQVEEYDLPVSMDAKRGSANYRKFVAAHGTDAHELESMPPETLRDLLRETIDGIIDTDAFNDEIDREAKDAAYLEGVRKQVHRALADLNLTDVPDQDEN